MGSRALLVITGQEEVEARKRMKARAASCCLLDATNPAKHAHDSDDGGAKPRRGIQDAHPGGPEQRRHTG